MIKIKRKQRHGFGSTTGEEEVSVLEGTIIACFFPETGEMTLKEIMERIDYSYERVNSALKSLADKNIVSEKKVGKTLIYSLDLQNLYSQIGFNAYMLQREIEFIKKNKQVYAGIKKIVESPYSLGVILFGSYSKGTETKQSDVDLICIASNKEKIGQLIKSLKYETNFNFNSVNMFLHEFADIEKDNPELWDDLKNYGLVFKGEDTFYFWVYENEKD